MGKDSSIEWTHHTFNPWWGCIKVSPGCEHCYAETLSKRFGHNIWGPAKTTTRRTFGEKHWAEPIKWDRLAQVSGRKRVFCASMADVFEDHPMLPDERVKLWALIEQTPMLDWLLLTKRPENIAKMMPIRWGADPYLGIFDDTSLMPQNIWIGTSVENDEQVDERIPHLLKVPARVRFLSCEPLLGPIDLTWSFRSVWLHQTQSWAQAQQNGTLPSGIHWVIAGGESGHGARAMHPDWARGLRDQCQAAGVAFLFKQWGEWAPYDRGAVDTAQLVVHGALDTPLSRFGKHAAGRLLDGREWNQFPE